jgi:transcriptional regulator
MYVPPKFKVDDHAASLELMRRYPLATLISSSGSEGSFVSHLPLIAETSPEGITLVGHLARANPHWKHFSKGSLTAVFCGPNAYITPHWYKVNDVPTWNYAVVHAVGRAEIIESYDGIIDCLKKLSDHMNQSSQVPWEFWLPEDLNSRESLPRAIVGFRVSVQSLVAKFKLSQNRSTEDREGVRHGLSQRDDDQSRQLLELMNQIDR